MKSISENGFDSIFQRVDKSIIYQLIKTFNQKVKLDFRMNENKKVTSIIYVKNNYLNWMPSTEQTKRIRSTINSKIRELGDKYYKTKAFLERMNFHRDDLYRLGKYLEELYKNKKKGVHLQVQTKRSKEALYCWFAEHFYNELLNMNSSFWVKLKADFSSNLISNIQKSFSQQYNLTHTQNQTHLVNEKVPIQSQKTINNLNIQLETNPELKYTNKNIPEDQKSSSNCNDIFKDIEHKLKNDIDFDFDDIFYYY